MKNLDIRQYYIMENGHTQELSKLVSEEADPGNLHLYIPDLCTGLVEKRIMNLNFAGINSKAFSTEVIRFWYFQIYVSTVYYSHVVGSFLTSNPPKLKMQGLVLYSRLKDIENLYHIVEGTSNVSPAAINLVQFYRGIDFSALDKNIEAKLKSVIQMLQKIDSRSDDLKHLATSINSLLKTIWIYNKNISLNNILYCDQKMARNIYIYYQDTVHNEKYISKKGTPMSEIPRKIIRNKTHNISFAILSQIMKESIAYMQEKYIHNKTFQNKSFQDMGFTSDSITTLDKYLLTDRECVYQLICPKCNNQLIIKRYNIPVFDDENHFISYYTQSLLYCQYCKHQLMTEAVYSDIQKRVSANNQHLAPSNVTLKRRTRDNTYLYEPIAHFALYFERTSKPHDGSSIATLAKSSFLADEGYNLRLNELHRHQILQSAIKKYGLRRVADHIRFLITTREGQKNGRMKYAQAIKKWQSDLDFVVSNNNSTEN